MTHRILIFLSLFVLALFASFAISETTIPDTPAGQALRSWLEAFNSGDQAKIETYVKTMEPKQSVEFLMSFRKQTGGFELLSIESSEPMQIRFRVKEKGSPTEGFGNLRLKSAQPVMVDSLDLRAIPPGATVEIVKLDAAARERVIAGIAANLKEFYVYPESAQKMTDALGARQQRANTMRSPMAMRLRHSSRRIYAR